MIIASRMSRVAQIITGPPLNADLTPYGSEDRQGVGGQVPVLNFAKRRDEQRLAIDVFQETTD